MYSPLPYAAAQGLIEIPYIAVQTLVFGLITYLMVNFEKTAGKFFLYLLFMFLTFTYFTFYGMMAVGFTASQQLAAVISSAFYSLWNLLSGFLIPKTGMYMLPKPLGCLFTSSSQCHGRQPMRFPTLWHVFLKALVIGCLI
ncbi:unnamed protein product [Lathyrus sativus]|nr:unnamed protein product [Lathyrus sativus]